jgi:hypothetical protein
MPKIKMITVGHCNWKTWEGCCRNLYATKSAETEIEHYFVYHYYPINEPENRVQLERIAKEYNLIWLDPGKNIGGVMAYNWAQDNFVHADEYLWGFDPDTQPVGDGWDLAMHKVISDPSIGWASLMCDATPNEIKARSLFIKEQIINGVNCYICDTPMALSTGVTKMSWVNDAGGMLPRHGFYGGTEIYMWPYLKTRKLNLAILKDYKDVADIKNATSDPIYHVWKARHAFKGYPNNFDVFLKELRFNEGENQNMNTWEYFTEVMRGL